MNSYDYKIAGKKLLATGLSIGLLMQPITSNAAESNLLAKDILNQAGFSTMIENTLSQEEYIAIAKEAEGALWGYTNLGIANVESGNLNIRESASTSAKLVGKLPKDAACEVVEVVGEWAKIVSGEVEGYVNKEYLLTGPDSKLRAQNLIHAVVVVNVDSLKVRDNPNIDSAVLTMVPMGEELEYVETLDGWYKVSIDGTDGYVSSEFSVMEEKLKTAITMSELLYGQGVSDVRVDLVEYAKQYLGNPYVWGGTSLTKGADCSGFVLSVFKKFGVSLSHSSGAQSKEGTKISESELQAGDLIFYANSSGKINHVAIYIGGGQVIHASSPKTGIKISTYKYRTPVKYVRVLQD